MGFEGEFRDIALERSVLFLFLPEQFVTHTLLLEEFLHLVAILIKIEEFLIDFANQLNQLRVLQVDHIIDELLLLLLGVDLLEGILQLLINVPNFLETGFEGFVAMLDAEYEQMHETVTDSLTPMEN